MRRVPTTGNAPPGPGRARAVRLALVSCYGALGLLAALSGCQNTRAPKGDPLVGDIHPKPGFGPAPPAGKTSRSASGVPAIPTATAATSPAEIAQSGPQPLDDPLTGGRPLGIPGGGAGQTTGGWQGTPTAGPGGKVNPGLGAPEMVARPLPPAPPPNPGVVPAGSWHSPYAGLSYEQLQDRLSARKVTMQHQETVPGGWKFTCSVPNPFNPDFSRTYEATARDYKSALIAVLDKIDSDRQPR
jgi:hypothetical protein